MARRSRSSRDRGSAPAFGPDPLVVLGLPASATTADIEAARRTLAKRSHPDVGGSLAEMQRINAAADAAVRRLETLADGAAPGTSVPPPAPAARPRRPPSRQSAPVHRDHPSFTIEALPAAAFEALLIVASSLGDLIDDDPPYRLDVALGAPLAGWCRLELTPDAGASTISLMVGGEPGAPAPDLDRVRDAWIDELNRLDWDDLDGSPQQL